MTSVLYCPYCFALKKYHEDACPMWKMRRWPEHLQKEDNPTWKLIMKNEGRANEEKAEHALGSD